MNIDCHYHSKGLNLIGSTPQTFRSSKIEKKRKTLHSTLSSPTGLSPQADNTSPHMYNFIHVKFFTYLGIDADHIIKTTKFVTSLCHSYLL